jgi:hypothetical protein
VVVISRRPTLGEPARLGIELPLGAQYISIGDDDTRVGMLGFGIGLQVTWAGR